MKILNSEQIRQLEHQTEVAGISMGTLMEASGLAIARHTVQFLDGIRGKRIIFLIGSGNNGGDGLVTARYLSDWGGHITLYLLGDSRKHGANFEECRSRRMRIVNASEDPEQLALSSYLALSDLAVDAIVGLGKEGPLREPTKQILRCLNAIRSTHPNLKMLAVDLPSGLDADKGRIDSCSPEADITITLGAPKLGMFIFPGAAYVGHLEIADIGLVSTGDDPATPDLLNKQVAARHLPKRPLDGHKGLFGHVVVIGGSKTYIGAPILSCTAAYRAGAGLVTLATPKNVYKMAATNILEAVHVPLPETPNGSISIESLQMLKNSIGEVDAAVLGPGLGNEESLDILVEQLLLIEPKFESPLILDADVLTILARIPKWWERLATPCILTPHPGEMASLLKCSIEDILADRISAARTAAKLWGKVVVLKGAYTIIAAPNGANYISPFANPVLATAGTGDILAGIIASFVAQGAGILEGALLGVFVHGMAGEELRKVHGEGGLLASDLFASIPKIVHQLRET